MGNYPLIKSNKEGTYLHPQCTFYSDEYAEKICTLHLREEIHNDENGKLRKCYRLYAKQPHNIEMALAYDIKCPKCSRGMLKQIGRCIDSHMLGLYSCPMCYKK